MLILFVLFSCYDLASLGQLAGDLKIEVAIVQIIMFRPKPAQFERRKSAAKPLVLDNSLFTPNIASLDHLTVNVHNVLGQIWQATRQSRYRTLFPYKPAPRPTFLRHTQRSRIQKLGLFWGLQKIFRASEAVKKKWPKIHHFLGKKINRGEILYENN